MLHIPIHLFIQQAPEILIVQDTLGEQPKYIKFSSQIQGLKQISVSRDQRDPEAAETPDILAPVRVLMNVQSQRSAGHAGARNLLMDVSCPQETHFVHTKDLQVLP